MAFADFSAKIRLSPRDTSTAYVLSISFVRLTVAAHGVGRIAVGTVDTGSSGGTVVFSIGGVVSVKEVLSVTEAGTDLLFTQERMHREKRITKTIPIHTVEMKRVLF